MVERLEEIKTENDARTRLIEKVLEIDKVVSDDTNTIYAIEDVSIGYKTLRNYIQKKFGIDTTPYDNVAKNLLPKTILERAILENDPL